MATTAAYERDEPFSPPADHNTTLLNDQPRASFLQSEAPSTSPPSPTPNNSTPLLEDPHNKEMAAPGTAKPPAKRRGPLFWALLLLVLAVVVVAVIVPVYFTVIKPRNDRASSSEGSSGNSSPNNGGPSPNGNRPSSALTTGGDGSEITMDNGTTFTYENKFGGFWVWDAKDPFNSNAQPNSWTPPLNQSWNFVTDRIYGVNLGGLFVLEPFISPALFQKYPGTSDEWDLSLAMRADEAGGGINQIEEHYKTFITEKDIAEIAAAGLNWIRLPIPYWAIETWEGEPFLERVSWKYILKVLDWCRKYGLRVKIDLHTIPGSQNGYNHSGKFGQVNFLNGPMGLANAQRALEYIRTFTQFFSQPEYKDVVVMFGIVNEAHVSTIRTEAITSFYIQAHQMIRDITGVGAGNGPYIVIGDGFRKIPTWAGFMQNSDRIAMDTHPYFAFGDAPNVDPIATGLGDDAGGRYPRQACSVWGPEIREGQTGFGVIISGEFSNGFNDCGLFLRGTRGRAETPGCEENWNDSSKYNETTKAGLQAYAEASMDALQDWFFWTWRIGEAVSGTVETPLWSYKLGLDGGWMPKDPRVAAGKCARLGVDLSPAPQSFAPWQTGGAGAGQVPASSTSSFPWPPVSIQGVPVPATELPQYTPTGTVVTLPPPSYSPTQTMDGWFNDRDRAGAPTPIPGCAYPPAWDAVNATFTACPTTA